MPKTNFNTIASGNICWFWGKPKTQQGNLVPTSIQQGTSTLYSNIFHHIFNHCSWLFHHISLWILEFLGHQQNSGCSFFFSMDSPQPALRWFHGCVPWMVHSEPCDTGDSWMLPEAEGGHNIQIWLVVSNIFIFTPTWGNDPILTKIFQMALKPLTGNYEYYYLKKKCMYVYVIM